MIDNLRHERLMELETEIGYSFSNTDYLKSALTHSSAATDGKYFIPCNERIEFLGDAVLELVVSDYLYRNCANKNEGTLSRLRAKLVCENALYRMAGLIGLSAYLRLGKGEEMSGGREKPSLVSDAFEAVIGAIYLDGGIEPAKAFIQRFVIEPQFSGLADDDGKDGKTRLQEVMQSAHLGTVSYRLTGEDGPDHKKIFSVDALLNETVIGSGTGTSKRRAEEMAAEQALTRIQAGELPIL